MRKELDYCNITLYGNVKNIARAEELMNKIKDKLGNFESRDRTLIQDNVCDKVRCDVLYGGNTVYGKETVLKDFRKIVKNGVKDLTEDLYEVFHLNFGTIAHYDRNGWISNYPNMSDIKSLVENASFPDWHTDLEVIRGCMINILKNASI